VAQNPLWQLELNRRAREGRLAEIFGTYREQFNAVAQPQFQFDQTFNTKLWNPVVKGTYQINQKNKLIGYFQWGQKEQPNRLPFAAYTYTDPSQTFAQDSGSWVYKAEWNGTISDRLYLEARYGEDVRAELTLDFADAAQQPDRLTVAAHARVAQLHDRQQRRRRVAHELRLVDRCLEEAALLGHVAVAVGC